MLYFHYLFIWVFLFWLHEINQLQVQYQFQLTVKSVNPSEMLLKRLGKDSTLMATSKCESWTESNKKNWLYFGYIKIIRFKLPDWPSRPPEPPECNYKWAPEQWSDVTSHLSHKRVVARRWDRSICYWYGCSKCVRNLWLGTNTRWFI